MSKHTEAQLLEAMAHATLPEQRKIRAELDQLRTEAARQAEEDREVDVANAVIEAHLTPVLVHGMHSTATDWLGEDVEDFGVQDLPQITSSMRVEASHWYRNVSPGVKANRYELREQARGVAARYASQYGSVADRAQEAFMQQVARLVVAEGTDMAGVPSAAGDNTNPELVAWSDEADDMGTNEGSPPPAYDAYTPVEGGGGTPQPQAPAPATSGDPGEPTDTAPSAQTTLPVEDTHNDPGDAAATGEIPPVSARYETAQQRAIRQYLAVEEGTEPPVPGVADIEQDGEAGTTLPLEVSVSGHPESLDTFVPATPSKPAPSTRAPNVTGSRRVVAKVVGELEEYIVRNRVTAATMTRQHFQHIADSISTAPVDEKTRTKLAHHFADRLGATNGQFQRQRFIDAATRKTASRPDKGDWSATCGTCGAGPFNAVDIVQHQREEHGAKFSGTPDTDSFGRYETAPVATARRTTAVATGPNPQGSFVYDPIVVEAKGYEEGFAYALTWSPGKPIPAALTSAASIGNKYNAEYVAGYQAGVTDGIASLSADFQSAFTAARQKAVVLSRRFPKSSSLPQLQLADMDDSVSNPFTWSTPTRGGSGGAGAADVASVPTPGQGVADYPQPGSTTPTPSVGDGAEPVEPIEPENTASPVVADPAQVEAFRRRVRANLGR